MIQTRALIVVITTACTIFVVAACCIVGRKMVEWREFGAQREEMYRIVEGWKVRPPPGVNAHAWREACTLSTIAIGNVCFTPDHVATDEMRALRADLIAKANAPVDSETLQWLLDRLAATGSHGNRYIRQMQPLWDEALDSLRPQLAEQ
jgi:hypothetical protein